MKLETELLRIELILFDFIVIEEDGNAVVVPDKKDTASFAHSAEKRRKTTAADMPQSPSIFANVQQPIGSPTTTEEEVTTIDMDKFLEDRLAVFHEQSMKKIRKTVQETIREEMDKLSAKILQIIKGEGRVETGPTATASSLIPLIGRPPSTNTAADVEPEDDGDDFDADAHMLRTPIETPDELDAFEERLNEFSFVEKVVSLLI